MGAIAVCILQL